MPHTATRAVPALAALTALAAAGTAVSDWVSQDLQASPVRARSGVGETLALFQPEDTAGSAVVAPAAMWAGAPLATGAASESGLVHAWRFQTNPGMHWVGGAALASGSPQPGAGFGSAIAWGRTVDATGATTNTGFLVVGSPRWRLTAGSAAFNQQVAGYAEAFAIANALTAPAVGTPVQLPHPAPTAGIAYGSAVATTVADGTPWAFVSAPREAVTVAGTRRAEAGTIQCFRRDGATSFVHVASLVEQAPDTDRRLGDALCAAGNRIYASTGFSTPRIAVFRIDAGTPVFEAYVNYAGASTAWAEGFGTSISCDGTFLAVGAPGPWRSPPGTGRVWIYDAAPPFALRGLVESPFPNECAGFGTSVSIARGTLAVGTAEGDGALQAGMACGYSVDPVTAAVTPLFTEANAGETGFGFSVASGGLHVAIGAPADGTGIEGSVRMMSVRSGARTPDLNGDRIVDGADLGLLLGMYRTSAPGSPGDLNYDGQVNGADLGLLLSAWGTVP